MKYVKTLSSIPAAILVLAVITCAIHAPGQTPSGPQTASANASVSVRNDNGRSVVILNGREIYSGSTTGTVASRSYNINGVEYSAVYDGGKLLWENVPGAGQQLQSQQGTTGGLDPGSFAAQHKEAFDRMVAAQRQFMQSHGGFSPGSNWVAICGASRCQGGSAGGAGCTGQTSGTTDVQSNNTDISIRTTNGSTVIVFQGRDISVGPTHGQISAKTRSFQGEHYAAAYENDRVIWENVPGAARQLK
jgi:hypothetical protein